MIQTLRSALASLFQLLPVQVSNNDGAELSPPVQQAVPVNFVVVVLNGLFFPTAQRILGPGLLLTWFVTQLTPAALWVGLIVPVQQGLALLAQPFVAEWLTGKPRRSRYYTAQGLLRAALWAALGLGVWLIGRNQPSLLLVLFFLTVGIDAAAGGLGNIAFNDVIARTIPPRVRGQARGYRGILGGLATAAAGYLIRTS